MELRIDPEFDTLIPPLEKSERERLEKSIDKEGIRNPIMIWKGFIVDGHNRYNIATKTNIKFKTKDIKFKDRSEAILWIINNQLGRRNISAYDRTRLALRYEEILKTKAKENQSTHTKQGYQTFGKAVHIDKEIAEIAKVSHYTVSKVKFIEDKADKKTKEKLSKGEETINKVYTNLKRKEKVKDIHEELSKPNFKTNSKYEIVYADPAWNYNKKIGEGMAHEQYITSSLETMKQIPINNISAENAILAMWVTMPMLEEGLELMKSWGFKYKTCLFNWIKLNKNGKPFFGIGNYTKSNSELCLLGVKGKGLMVLDNTISQIIMKEKTIHSKKPEEVRDLIVQLFGDRKRIELFAREKVKGWDNHGNEVKK